MSTHYNNVAQAVSGTPGTGTITLGSAVTGAQTLGAAAGGNATVDVFITDGSAWEVARNCTYTHSGTTLTRGTLEASSTGSALSLTSAAVVRVALPATKGNRLEASLQSMTPGGRITTESGVPVSTSDRTSQSTIYYTPFVHNVITLWDGNDWVPVTFSEVSLALGTLTSGANYDVFGYLSSGALTLEMLVWTNNTTRATAVTLQDGRYCKSGDKTRLYLGTFRTTSTTTTEDSGARSTTAARKRFVWNAYNRVRRALCIEEDTSSWTHTGSTAWRQVRASSDNQFEAICGLPGEAFISIQHFGAHGNNTVNGASSVGVGYDSTSAISNYSFNHYTASASGNSGIVYAVYAALNMALELGYHYWAALEANFNSANTITCYGTLPVRRVGMVGWVEA